VAGSILGALLDHHKRPATLETPRALLERSQGLFGAMLAPRYIAALDDGGLAHSTSAAAAAAAAIRPPYCARNNDSALSLSLSLSLSL